MDFNRKLIIVTGANGFIGRNVVYALSQNYHVIGLDEDSADTFIVSDANYDFIPCNFESSENVNVAFDTIREKYGSEIESVIHLAAFKTSAADDDYRYDQVNVKGTQRLLDALELFRVQQIIFGSTMFVHDSCRVGELIDETHAIKPKWADPAAKYEAEKLILARTLPAKALILRMAEIYDDFCHSIPLSSQIQSIYEHRLNSIIYPGDISCGKNYLHVQDFVSAVIAAVSFKNRLPYDLTLLVGEPDTLSYDYLQRVLGRLIHGQEWLTYQVPREIALSELWLKEKKPFLNEDFIKSWMVRMADDHFALDISRAEAILNWKPRHSLNRSLAKIIYSFKDDTVSWYQEHKLQLPSWLQKEQYQDFLSQQA